MKKICLQCGVEFETNRNYKKFCNTICNKKFHNNNAQKIKPEIVENCLYCNKKLNKKDYRQKFCNHSCSASYNNVGVNRYTNYDSIYCLECNTLLKSHQNKFCSISCTKIYNRRIIDTENKRKMLCGEKVDVRVLRKYIRTIKKLECSMCGGVEWFGRPMPLTMDHIDGNPTNDLLENLRLICPNCDRLTPTFGSKNMGRGRQSRGMKRYDRYDKTGVLTNVV